VGSSIRAASGGTRPVSCASDRPDCRRAQVTSRAPVTGRVVIFRGRFEGSTCRVHAGHEAVDEARAAIFHRDELVTARLTWTCCRSRTGCVNTGAAAGAIRGQNEQRRGRR